MNNLSKLFDNSLYSFPRQHGRIKEQRDSSPKQLDNTNNNDADRLQTPAQPAGHEPAAPAATRRISNIVHPYFL